MSHSVFLKVKSDFPFLLIFMAILQNYTYNFDRRHMRGGAKGGPQIKNRRSSTHKTLHIRRQRLRNLKK